MWQKTILVGNLGADPELREVGEGKKVARASLATNRRWKDEDGEAREDTQWHRIVFWGKTAELAAELLGKGKAVLVEGRLNYTKWEDADDQTHYGTEIVCSRFLLLSPRGIGAVVEGARPPETERR